MADETYEIGFAVEGDTAAVSSFRSVEGAQGRVIAQTQAASRQAAQAATQQAALSRTVQAGGRRWGELAGAVGNVGAVFGQTNPVLGQAGSLIGAVGTASTALTGALGPLGAAVAAGTTVFGLLLPMLRDTSDEMASVAGEANNAERAVRGLASAMRDREREASAQAGTAPAEDVRRELEENQQNLRAAVAREQELQGEMRSLFANLGATRDLSNVNQLSDRSRELRAELVPIQQEIERLRPLVSSMEEGLQRASASEGREAAEGTRVTDVAETAAAIEAARTSATESGEERRTSARAGGANRRRAIAEREAAEELRIAEEKAQQEHNINERIWQSDVRAAQRRAALREQEAEQEQASMMATWQSRVRFQSRVQSEAAAAQAQAAQEQQQRMEELAAQEMALNEERQRHMAQITDTMINTTLGGVTDAAGQMMKFALTSADTSEEAWLAMLDSYLEGTAIEYTIRSLSEAANAVAAAARYDYAAAAQHGVASAMAGAVAAATGFASVGIQTPSASSASAGAAAPAPGQQAGAGGGGAGTQNVTINLYSPQSVMTRAEQGQMLDRIETETRRALGGPNRR